MNTATEKAKHELRLALGARYVHSLDCPKWDYIDNGGCEQCDKHDDRIRRARVRLAKLDGTKAKGEA